jgi:RNA recognition motif-containing protein
MNTKLYVDNLAAPTTEKDLTELFSAYGNVVAVSLPANRTDDRPCGFGFVTMVTPEGARAAIQALNGKMIAGCALIVSEAWPHEEPAGLSNRERPPRHRPSHLF